MTQLCVDRTTRRCLERTVYQQTQLQGRGVSYRQGKHTHVPGLSTTPCIDSPHSAVHYEGQSSSNRSMPPSKAAAARSLAGLFVLRACPISALAAFPSRCSHSSVPLKGWGDPIAALPSPGKRGRGALKGLERGEEESPDVIGSTADNGCLNRLGNNPVASHVDFIGIFHENGDIRQSLLRCFHCQAGLGAQSDRVVQVDRAVMKWQKKRDIPEKTRRPVASHGTIPTYENPGVTWPEIEPGSPWWEPVARNNGWLAWNGRRPRCEGGDVRTYTRVCKHCAMVSRPAASPGSCTTAFPCCARAAASSPPLLHATSPSQYPATLLFACRCHRRPVSHGVPTCVHRASGRRCGTPYIRAALCSVCVALYVGDELPQSSNPRALHMILYKKCQSRARLASRSSIAHIERRVNPALTRIARRKHSGVRNSIRSSFPEGLQGEFTARLVCSVATRGPCVRRNASRAFFFMFARVIVRWETPGRGRRVVKEFLSAPRKQFCPFASHTTVSCKSPRTPGENFSQTRTLEMFAVGGVGAGGPPLRLVVVSLLLRSARLKQEQRPTNICCRCFNWRRERSLVLSPHNDVIMTSENALWSFQFVGESAKEREHRESKKVSLACRSLNSRNVAIPKYRSLARDLRLCMAFFRLQDEGTGEVEGGGCGGRRRLVLGIVWVCVVVGDGGCSEGRELGEACLPPVRDRRSARGMGPRFSTKTPRRNGVVAHVMCLRWASGSDHMSYTPCCGCDAGCTLQNKSKRNLDSKISDTKLVGWSESWSSYHDKSMRYQLYHDDSVTASVNISVLNDCFFRQSPHLAVENAEEMHGRGPLFDDWWIDYAPDTTDHRQVGRCPHQEAGKLEPTSHHDMTSPNRFIESNYRRQAAREVTSKMGICDCEYQAVKSAASRLDNWTRSGGRNNINPDKSRWPAATYAMFHPENRTLFALVEDEYSGTEQLRPRLYGVLPRDKIYAKHVYTEVDFAIGSLFIRHAPERLCSNSRLARKQVASTILPGVKRSRIVKGDIATCSKSPIAAKRKALNWRAVLSSCCVHLRDFKRRPYYFFGRNEVKFPECERDEERERALQASAGDIFSVAFSLDKTIPYHHGLLTIFSVAVVARDGEVIRWWRFRSEEDAVRVACLVLCRLKGTRRGALGCRVGLCAWVSRKRKSCFPEEQPTSLRRPPRLRASSVCGRTHSLIGCMRIWERAYCLGCGLAIVYDSVTYALRMTDVFRRTSKAPQGVDETSAKGQPSARIAGRQTT
ncbi:hypothetical protein PR048_009284 [Dryococelus australis]|uniref:Uncharacterized protein n=1 Tax=Dryococelus australis TaxID=614101 RepID=A0ABQ9HZF8_9NEOP|nr:hypothetical protein PR048_009284 [Dryococelus australis]